MPRAALQCFLRLGDREIVAAGAVVDQGERVRRPRVARVGRLPQFQRLGRAILVAGHAIVELVGDEQALALADPSGDAVRQPGVFLTASPFAQAAVHRRQRRVGGRELAIVLDRLVEERDRFDLAAAAPFLEAQGVRLERRQRRRRHLLDGHVEALHRRQRLAELRAHGRRDRAELGEHALPGRRFGLRARQLITGRAIGRGQRHHIVAAERGDRAFEHRLHAEPLADLARHLVGQRRVATGGPSIRASRRCADPE